MKRPQNRQKKSRKKRLPPRKPKTQRNLLHKTKRKSRLPKRRLNDPAAAITNIFPEIMKTITADLEERPLTNAAELEKWLQDISELEAVISEDASWRHIRMTCDTEDKKLQERFTFFMMEIQPKIQPFADRLNRKLVGSPLTASL